MSACEMKKKTKKPSAQATADTHPVAEGSTRRTRLRREANASRCGVLQIVLKRHAARRSILGSSCQRGAGSQQLIEELLGVGLHDDLMLVFCVCAYRYMVGFSRAYVWTTNASI